MIWPNPCPEDTITFGTWPFPVLPSEGDQVNSGLGMFAVETICWEVKWNYHIAGSEKTIYIHLRSIL